MLNIISIILMVLAAAMAAAGIFFLMRPVSKADKPVKGPVDVIKVRHVDTDSPDTMPVDSTEGQKIPVSAIESELEIADMHPGDILVGTEVPPEAGTGQNPTHEPPVEEHAGTTPEGQKTETDVVSKSISEEHEEAPEESPERPLELFDDRTY